MVMRIAELRKSECCPVIGQIEVALPFWDNITSPETEQTSRWCSNSRTFAEAINAAKQMTTRKLLVQLHTRLVDLSIAVRVGREPVSSRSYFVME
jgi:hypothetical protein